MRVFNYSEARQNFSSMLNTALREEVIITRKDGSKFKVVPIGDKEPKSPFDVRGVDSNIRTDEILDIIRESRQYD
jgi:antitoxin (DNA-binding transcriptional repressor) of toxin-antitoxin stability system